MTRSQAASPASDLDRKVGALVMLKGVLRTYGEKSDEDLAVFARSLDDLTADEVDVASQVILKNDTEFPTPARFHEIVGRMRWRVEHVAFQRHMVAVSGMGQLPEGARKELAE